MAIQKVRHMKRVSSHVMTFGRSDHAPQNPAAAVINRRPMVGTLLTLTAAQREAMVLNGVTVMRTDAKITERRKAAIEAARRAMEDAIADMASVEARLAQQYSQ